MQNIIVGIVIGVVSGVMFGTIIIAPKLDHPTHETAMSEAESAKEHALPEPVSESPPTELDRPVVRWRMASAYPISLPQLGSQALRVERNIWEVSDGGIEILLFEPDTLVPTSQIFDAVASGTIDAAFASSKFWSDKEPSLRLFSAIPFGPQPGEFLAWIYFGGGQDLLNEIYQPLGVHSVICGMIAPESSGWYRRRFTTPDDLKGLRMHASGLGAKVLNKIGVQTHKLKAYNIFLALENGEIDAAQFSMPVIDLKLGFNELASHYYFPGWQQPSSFIELIVNKSHWEALSKARKSQIEAVCGDNVRYGLAEGEALQFHALKELTARGVKIHRWPSSILLALKSAWKVVVSEQSAADANFKRVWRSLSDFRNDYTIWKELTRP